MWPFLILVPLLLLAERYEGLYEVSNVGTVIQWVWAKVCAPVIQGSLFVFGLDEEIEMETTEENVMAETEP
jgi:hypothetical protein